MWWPFARTTRGQSRHRVRDVWRGDQRLLSWSNIAAFSLDRACAGTFITGAPGSGKTTGSARTIAESYLRAGFGGLVMTVKTVRDTPLAGLLPARGTLQGSDHLAVRPGVQFSGL